MRGDMEGATGSAETPRPEQELDAPQVDPASSQCVAKACRSTCGWIAFGRCAACPASRQMLDTARVVMGRVRGCRERARERGFDCQYCRSNGRSFGAA